VLCTSSLIHGRMRWSMASLCSRLAPGTVISYQRILLGLYVQNTSVVFPGAGEVGCECSGRLVHHDGVVGKDGESVARTTSLGRIAGAGHATVCSSCNIGTSPEDIVTETLFSVLQSGHGVASGDTSVDTRLDREVLAIRLLVNQCAAIAALGIASLVSPGARQLGYGSRRWRSTGRTRRASRQRLGRV
jgi:hypothetical protein